MAPLVLPSGVETSNWFFPRRRRCLGCDRRLDRIVINRLFCGYACAGLVPPDDNVAAWPSYCRTAAGEPKQRYRCPEDVTATSADDQVMHAYPCDHCGMWHIGHRSGWLT